MSQAERDSVSFDAAERRGAALIAVLQGRWNFTALASSIFLSICVPFLLAPLDAIASNDAWATTAWFPLVYSILWGGTVVHALSTTMACILLSNIVASAHAADAEDVIAALSERPLVAGLYGRRAPLPVITRVLEVLLFVATLGTSWAPPTVLQAPFAFFRPCLLFFLAASSWSIYWTLPVAAFGLYVATAAFSLFLVVGMAGTALAVVEEHSSTLPAGRSRLAIYGVVRGSSRVKPLPAAAAGTGDLAHGLSATLLVQ